MKIRRSLRVSVVMLALLGVSLGLIACGQNFFFDGHPLPPSGVINRVLIAVQNPTVLSTGALEFVDAKYDIRHSFNNAVASFSISGYSGSLPVTIQNYPAEQLGGIFNQGDGSFTLANYGTEAVLSTDAQTSLGGVASSIFVTRDGKYTIAAQQTTHVVTLIDSTLGTFPLALPGAYRVSINPGGTVALAFVQNSDLVYSVVHLSLAQQAAAVNNPQFMGAQDCEPQNQPVYCAFAVSPGTAAAGVAAPGFDRPIKAVFSPDGSNAYVIDCGPECGGSAAGVTVIPLNSASLNPGVTGPSGISLAATSRIAIPGGATNAIFTGNTMYVAGQQLLADGLFTGELSVVDTQAGTVTSQTGISDGTHNKMLFADDNTLWIASTTCEGGERFKQAQAGATAAFGCMSMYNISTNTLTLIGSYKGDGTGIAAVSGLHKVYTAEGGQVYIYNTTTGGQIDNSNVSVVGTATDVAYMDGPTDDNNTTY